MSDLPEDIEPVHIVSFGVIIKETDEFIAIAQNYGDNPEQCCSLITIPKGCIMNIITIEEISEKTPLIDSVNDNVNDRQIHP